MLATTLWVDFDADKAWDERKQEYITSWKIIKTRHISQSAQWNKDWLRTTVISAAVFIPEEG
jgi:arginine decarboxylase